MWFDFKPMFTIILKNVFVLRTSEKKNEIFPK